MSGRSRAGDGGRTPTVQELRAFATIAAHRSFRSAADVLGVPASSLSHLMRALEDGVGVRLLHRTTRSVSLTEAGTWLLERLAPALDDIDDALTGIERFRQSPVGAVRIHAPEAAARLLLQHAVPAFIAAHPDCSVEISVEDRQVDIVDRGFDAGVRMFGAVPLDMIAVPFAGRSQFMAFASPSYLSRTGTPRHPDDLQAHRCIGARDVSGGRLRWAFEQAGRRHAVDAPSTLVLDHVTLLVEAALSGMGIIYVMEEVARPHVEAGQLVPVLADWCQPADGLSLYYCGRRQPPTSLKAFIKVLRRLYREDALHGPGAAVVAAGSIPIVALSEDRVFAPVRNGVGCLAGGGDLPAPDRPLRDPEAGRAEAVRPGWDQARSVD